MPKTRPSTNAVIGIQVRIAGTSYKDATSNAVLYAASIVMTIALSATVYWYYERWFLRRKVEFTVIANAPQLSPA